ncbi:TMEM175 family protein [Actinocatenispora rupis]|uniref:DUF1211 domain-containing membrane protein n=1 Tax=Actinocatenispora rupis TaxID=519421 RepID=A0A8J3ND97_9ACTN|nr:TMEM175 family protein [Actinocatenispora rupis]GID15124.1 DUF1211 domain-containing membrane protein [Actinocatenispora rupis]
MDNDPNTPETPAELAARVREEERLTRVEVEFAAAERLTFFSDAVVAIAITLLAIELPVPHGNTVAQLLHGMHEDLMEYIAFFISFTVIGMHWVGHHTVFRWLRRLDGRLRQFNLLWLLTIVLTPFATKLLMEDSEHGFPLQFGVYAAVQAVSGVLFVLMAREMAKYKLLRDGAPATLISNSYLRSGVMASAFAVSIPIAFVSHEFSYAVWILMPAVMRLAKVLRDRRQATADASSPHPQDDVK